MPCTGGSDGSYSSRIATCRAKPDCAALRTRSSTSWMLTAPRLDRRVVGKRLHAVDQRDDAVGLVADQLGQLAARRVGVLLQQLRRAADAGERVLDLVRQHRRHRRDRAGGVAMRQLAVHLVGHRALVQRQHEQVGPLPGQRPLNRRPKRRRTRGPSIGTSYSAIDAAGAPYRVDQREQRAVRRSRSASLLPTSAAAPAPKNCSAAGLTKRTVPLRSSDDHRARQGAAQDAPPRRARRSPAQAALRASAHGPSATPAAARIESSRPASLDAAARRSSAISAREPRATSIGLVDRGAELRRAGQPFRVPAEMLARDAQARIASRNGSACRRSGSRTISYCAASGGSGGAGAGLQPVDHLAR